MSVLKAIGRVLEELGANIVEHSERPGTGLVDLADLLGADLWILSGEALWHRHTTAGQRVATVRAVPAYGGSWICLEGPVFPQ